MKTAPIARWLTFLVVGLAVVTAQANTGLTSYPNATLHENDFNDADSFSVNVDGQILHLRLYFVDAPETHVGQAHDARRVQEQARYFGIDQPQQVIAIGERATEFTRNALAKPFTVYTAHSRALGGSTSQRIYGFVVTADGQDLGELLVKNGLARNFGVSRQNYAGMSHTEVESRLRDMEIAAALKRKGAWELSNPEMIVQFRAMQRQEKQALQNLMTSSVRILESPLDINSAAQRDLERIPGVGSVLATRIIAGRPYKTLEDLQQVKGVSKALLERISPYLSIESTKPVNG